MKLELLATDPQILSWCSLLLAVNCYSNNKKQVHLQRKTNFFDLLSFIYRFKKFQNFNNDLRFNSNEGISALN